MRLIIEIDEMGDHPQKWWLGASEQLAFGGSEQAADVCIPEASLALQGFAASGRQDACLLRWQERQDSRAKEARTVLGRQRGGTTAAQNSGASA